MQSLSLTWWKVRSLLRKHKRVVLCGVLFISTIWFMVSQQTAEIRKNVNILRTLPCSDDDSQKVIETICSLYKNKEIVGDLCEPLCNKQLIRFLRCLNHKYGKYVSEVECIDICKPEETVTAVLKMAHNNTSGLHWHLKKIDKELIVHLQLPGAIDKINIHDFTVTSRSLSLYVSELLHVEYGLTLREGQDMLNLVWNDNYAKYFHGSNTSLLFARSLWSVFSQNEYKVSKVFSDWDVFPKIYSSCGDLYLVENAPGLKSLNAFFSFFVSGYPSWKSRAETALSILQLIQRMESMEHSLQLCDLKSPHFGITPDNNVRFIDADTVFTDQTLNQDLGSSNCTEHHDCDFFDCEGWCHKGTGKCSPLRTNNNLQMVCAKIFRDSGAFFSTYGGLLASPPSTVAAELLNLVDDCADSVTEKTVGEEKVKFKTPDLGYVSKLSELLFDSLHTDTES